MCGIVFLIFAFLLLLVLPSWITMLIAGFFVLDWLVGAMVRYHSENQIDPENH